MMRNRVILFEKEYFGCFSKIKKYNEVYSYEGNAKNVNRLPSDFLGMVEHYISNYRAGKIIDWVYDSYIKSNEVNIINEAMNDKRAYLFVKKDILYALGHLFYSFILAEKFIEQYKINEPIDFIPKEFPYSLYKIIAGEKNMLPKGINIPDWYIKMMKRRESFKNYIYRLAMKMYPLGIILAMKIGSSRSEPLKHYPYGMYLWDSAFGDDVPYFIDLLVDDDGLKHKDILYVMDKKISKNNLGKIKVKGYNYCYFKEMIKECDVVSYLRKICGDIIKLNDKLSSIKFNNRMLLARSCLNALRWSLLWEIFYLRYRVDKFIAIQEPGNTYRVLIQKRHHSQNALIFLSSSVPVYPIDTNGVVDSYCSFLVYDEMISGKIAIDYFKKNRNFIQNYTESGIIKSDIVYKMKHDLKLKTNLKREMGIPEDKIIIGFFDTSIGKTGMFNEQEGYEMIRDIYRLLDSKDIFYIIYKTRGKGNLFFEDCNAQKEFEKFIAHKRVFYVNKKIKPYYTGQYYIGISDLIIGVITSSVVQEAVVGGVKTICYVPPGRFNRDVFIAYDFPHFYAQGFEKLKECTDYWLNQCSEDDFFEFQQRYIKKQIDTYCDGNAIKRIHLKLRQYCVNSVK